MLKTRQPCSIFHSVFSLWGTGMRLAVLLLTFLSAQQLVLQPSVAQELPKVELEKQQRVIAERYRKIEELLLRLADVEAAENPERAALLRRAARQSREQFILDRLETAAGALSSKQYQAALDSQSRAQEQLESLLKLLTSEDRPQRIREERQRISNFIKDLKRIERTERATRARTENGAALEDVAREQEEIADRAREIEDELEGDDQDVTSEPNESDPESTESKSGDQEQESDAPSEGQESEPKNASEQGEESEASSESEDSSDQSSEQSDPSESSNSDQQSESAEDSQSQSEQEGSSESPQESPSGESSAEQQEPPPRTPEEAAKRAVEKARERMEQAKEKLDQAKRDEAVEEQRKAEEELRAAIDQLEKILRQLREEEMLRELARLESRLRQMAQMQGEVLDKTRQLAQTPKDQRDRQIDIRSGNLAFDEKKIVLEADRAILLLREEGSSVAFPEVVQQIREDMIRVADRLTETKIDQITQGLQEDILAALEEMVSALQKAQRDLEEQQRNSQQGQQPMQQGEPPLVQPLAELKLLRTLQTRIKSRTENYAEMIPTTRDEDIDPDLLGLLRGLSERQQQLYRISRDLLLQRNQ